MKSLKINKKSPVMAHFYKKEAFERSLVLTEPWSSLVEGDEQPDRPNGQTCVECGYVYAELIF